jgi:hypothetical protein
MTLNAPGWYPDPDPSGAAGQRYWDGKNWGPAAPVAPPTVAARKGRFSSSSQFLMLAVGAFVGALVSFFLMQLLFGAAAGDGSSLLFEVLGFLAFAVWLCCVVAVIGGVIGAVWRSVRKG